MTERASLLALQMLSHSRTQTYLFQMIIADCPAKSIRVADSNFHILQMKGTAWDDAQDFSLSYPNVRV